MLNTDKVRGILRAKQGSLIPKYQEPFGPLSTINPLNKGSFMPFTGTLKNQGFTVLDYYNYLETLRNKLPDFRTPINKETGNSNTSNQKDFSLKDDVLKPIGSALGNTFSDIINSPDALKLGLNVLDNSFNNVVNSSGIDGMFLAGDFITDIATMINPAVGLAGKGALTAIKGVNSLGGSTTRDFSIDLSMANQIGSSYGGSMHDIINADDKAGKKYGLFSGGSRRRANRLIGNAEQLQNKMIEIANNTRDIQALSGNDLNYTNYNFNLSGGYDLRYMRAAKSGMKLLDKIDFIKSKKIVSTVINLDTKEIKWEPIITEYVEEFKEGGNLPELLEPIIEDTWEPIITDYIEEYKDGGKVKLSFEVWFNSIPKDCRADGYDYKKAYEVFDWETLSNHAKDPDKYHLYSVSPIPDENGNYPFLKLGKVEENPELQGEFDWYNSEDGKEHRNKFDVQFINDRYYYVPKKFKDGGKTKELEAPEIEETSLKNLIPEGALHKNKHHMEHSEGLTKKGIPVIDNDGEQLAEIELDEIIFTLEVTKKLEELYKDGSDKAAIEAGKLLVKEILFNTDDRTGLISKCAEGGKINELS